MYGIFSSKYGGWVKRYLITNTCNKPRIVIRDETNSSYIPLTNNIKSGIRIGNSCIGEYESYTYGRPYTVTTCTSYQTRESTSGTVYLTKDNIVESYDTFSSAPVFRIVDSKSNYTHYVYGTITSINDTNTHPKAGTSYNIYVLKGGPKGYLSYNDTINSASLMVIDIAYATRNIIKSCYGTMYQESYTRPHYTDKPLYVRHNIVVRQTTGTSYQTRASTYNTIYLTKENIETLTSSSWR